MTKKHDILNTPYFINSKKIKNRYTMAPCTLMHYPDLLPNAEVIDYYTQRAKHNVGLLITESVHIPLPESFQIYPQTPIIGHEKDTYRWKALVDGVKKYDNVFLCQLHHVGSAREPECPDYHEYPAQSPSGIVNDDMKNGEAMTLEKIDQTIEAYRSAAIEAKKAGFDGVEISAATGYLIYQFFSEINNKRTDEYGGDIEQRNLFAIKVIQAIRQSCGDDFIIGMRISIWSIQHGGMLVKNPATLKRWLKPLADAGVDVFHCLTHDFRGNEFEGHEGNLAFWVKKVTGKPAIVCGSVGSSLNIGESGMVGHVQVSKTIDNLDPARQSIENNDYDGIALGRALLANADFVDLINASQGHKLKDYDVNVDSIQNYFLFSPELIEAKKAILNKQSNKRSFYEYLFSFLGR